MTRKRPIQQPRSTGHRWRRLLAASTATLAGVTAATTGISLVATGPAGATAAPPQIATLVGSGGTTVPTTATNSSGGVPAASAELSPTSVTFDPVTGDEVVASTVTNDVYLIAGGTGEPATDFGIATSGTLAQGNVYLIAGNGTAGLVADPGGSGTPAATANSIVPMSITVDANGNVLVAGNQTAPAGSVLQVVAATSGTYYGAAMSAGGLNTIAASGAPGGGSAPVTAISFAVGGDGFGLAVDSQGNVIVSTETDVYYLNFGSSTLSLYGQSESPGAATSIAGGSTGNNAACVTGPSSGTFFSIKPVASDPVIDTDGNLYLTSAYSAAFGCVWELPVATGTLDSGPLSGTAVTAGNVYKVAGDGGTTATSDGISAEDADVAYNGGAVLDANHNLVLAVGSNTGSGTSPAIEVVAGSTGTFYGRSMTQGDIYTIAGGASATGAIPGAAAGAELSNPVSLATDSAGDLYLADDAGSYSTTTLLFVPTSGNLDEITQPSTTLPPTVRSINPSAGLLAGGTSVTITGSNLTGATAVDFGSTAASSFSVNSSSSITAISPAGSAGAPVDVTVTTSGGTSATSSSDRFTYNDTPVVTGVSPSAGPVAGGTSVTITGTSLSGATAVTFGSTAASSFTVNSDSSITAVSPAGSAGAPVDVTVTTAGGTSATLNADQFTYEAVPTVSVLSASAGPSDGGAAVTITGNGFVPGATTVDFGTGNPAMVRSGTTATSITVTSPTGGPGAPVDVTVTTAGGTSTTSSADQFSFDASPTFSSINPFVGTPAGGQTVTITGTNFVPGATTVDMAGACTSVDVTSSTTLTCTTPPNGTGNVLNPANPSTFTDVTVTTPGGSGTVQGDQFSPQTYTYELPPTLTLVTSPDELLANQGAAGLTTGGEEVVLAAGTGRQVVTSVDFGPNNPAQIVPDTNGGTVIVPPDPKGTDVTNTVDIIVTTPAGTSSPDVGDEFTYVPPAPTVSGVSPATGTTAGGTAVTITGTNLATTSAVDFGSTPATSFTVNGTGSVSAVTPPGTAGTVDVTVQNAGAATSDGGTSGKSAADQFTYVTPAPSNNNNGGGGGSNNNSSNNNNSSSTTTTTTSPPATTTTTTPPPKNSRVTTKPRVTTPRFTPPNDILKPGVTSVSLFLDISSVRIGTVLTVKVTEPGTAKAKAAKAKAAKDTVKTAKAHVGAKHELHFSTGRLPVGITKVQFYEPVRHGKGKKAKTTLRLVKTEVVHVSAKHKAAPKKPTAKPKKK